MERIQAYMKMDRDRIFILIAALSFMSTISVAQTRDTLKLSITRIVRPSPDTVYLFSSHVDTIALQPLITDTSKVVRDENPQDLAESKYMVNLMGSVRVNTYYDFKGMPDTEGFIPYDIPVGKDVIDNLSSVYIGARQSRLGLEGRASTSVGTIKTYLEVDFASSTSSFWRLRHAYAEWNYFKMGYTWSTFMDNASLPVTVDFEGPNSALLKRHGVIRYERKYGEHNIVGIGLEAPSSDYSNPADSLLSGKEKQSNFDIAGRYRYDDRWGHVQVAGIFRRIDYLDTERMNVMYGWGVLASSVLKIRIKHSLFLQYSAGYGIANYYVGFSGRQLDAVYNPDRDNMQLKPIHGGFLSYSYMFHPLFRFSITSGISRIVLRSFEPDDAFKSGQYIAINVFFQPIETINIGLEVTGGSRINKDNQNGKAGRISLLTRFDF